MDILHETPTHNNIVTQKKRTAWSFLFAVLKLIRVKDLLIQHYLFRAPNPPTYAFVRANQSDNEDPLFDFVVTRHELQSQIDTPISAIQLFSLRDGVGYMTPTLHLRSTQERSKTIIIYSHGNSSDLGTTYWTCSQICSSLETDIIMYDYAGYGISPRETTEENIYQDLETVLCYVVTVLRYNLNEIFLWGFSLGTGPTVEIGKKYRALGGIILNSPLASCLAWLDKSPEKPLQGYKGPDFFCNLTKMNEIHSKVLIIHGDNDAIIPSDHAQALYKKLKDRKPKGPGDTTNNEWLILVPQADHNDIPFFLSNPVSDLKKKVKSILDFMYVAKKLEKRKPEMKEIMNEETLQLKKMFSDIRINDVGTWRKLLKRRNMESDVCEIMTTPSL